MRLFQVNGYVGTSVECIALESSCSMTAVHEEFTDRIGIFGAIVSDVVEQGLQLRIHKDDNAIDLGTVLMEHGRQIVSLSETSDLLFLYRLTVWESAAAPELASAFFEYGPRRLSVRIAKQIMNDCEQFGIQADVTRAISNWMATLLYAQIHLRCLSRVSSASQEQMTHEAIGFLLDAILQNARASRNNPIGRS
ncbi:TetR/AcrR family transcriptional regulator C-terminal domain-containing protein [Phyllobacterium bourgognense]|nr:TetR/AcrR family transcriptional regulator C-terminal domain-containing protein [Phyllobacterium bourgognense]